MINLSKNEEQLAQSMKAKVNLSKDKDKLEKHIVSLSKSVVNLSKQSGIDIGEHKARVVVVLDYSGSMNRMYKDGTVQETLDRLVPFGLMFDDNGEIDVYRFEYESKELKPLTIDNYDTYVQDVIKPNWGDMGGTKYAPVLKDINSKYFKKSLFGKVKDSSPVFVIFITDGDNSDKGDTNKIVVETAKNNMFIQFIGIGNESFSYLQKLDDLSGRECDNTGFVKFSDIRKLSDDELYNKVLEQYPDWLKEKGLK